MPIAGNLTGGVGASFSPPGFATPLTSAGGKACTKIDTPGIALRLLAMTRGRTKHPCRDRFYVGTGVPDGPKSLLLEEKALTREGAAGAIAPAFMWQHNRPLVTLVTHLCHMLHGRSFAWIVARHPAL